MNIVRLITFESFSQPLKQLFFELKILNIFKINDYFSGLFMHRFEHCKNLPEYFDRYFI